MRFLPILVLILAGPGFAQTDERDSSLYQDQEDVFGPGIKMDKTGRPYRWEPIHSQDGIVLDPVIVDAYGLGIGMDAAGKPVRPVED